MLVNSLALLFSHFAMFAHRHDTPCIADERLRIKALCAKIRSLEEENVGIVARLEEAEATLRKVQKGNAEKRETTDVAQLNSSDDEGISGRKQQNPLIETLAVSLQENESRSRKYGSLESADEGQGVEKELRQQAADSRKIVDSRNEELIEARDEIGCLKRELEEAHDRIQHMECANFELERELKEARTSASLAEDTAKQASERLVVLAGAEEHLFAGQQHNVEELLQTSLETTNSLRHQLAEMESEMALVKEELNTRTAELNAAKEEARESRNALDCAKLATYEVEADDEGVQALKQQLTEVESEMALVKAELNTRNEELNVAKEEARESRNELERAKLTISAMEDVEEEARALKQQLVKMESEMALVTDELSTREEELSAAKEEARRSQYELERAKLTISEMEAVDEKAQALKQQLIILALLKPPLFDLTEMESEMALVKAELNTRNEELSAAKEEARESRSELERAKLTISAMEDVEEEAQALKQELVKMESEMALVMDELNTREEELSAAKEEARRSQYELERAKLTISEMEAVEEEAQALKQQLAEMESEMANVKDELNTRKEELSAAKEETRRSRNELEHAKLAMSEMEAVDREVQALKQQLDKEKASLATEWTEVRSMLVNKEREIPLTSSRQLFLPTHRTEELSRRLEELESAVAQLNASVKPQTNRLVSTDDERGKQNLAKLKEGMETVCDEERLHVRKLNTVGEGRSAANVGPVEFEEELEKRYEASLANADCAIVGMLSLNKLAAQTNGEKQLSLAQPIQRVNTEAQNAETSVQDERECAALLSGIEAAIRAMNEARRVVENLEQEKSEPEERQQVEDSESAHMMEDESSLAATADDLCTIALNDEGQNSPSVEEDCGLETVEELKREIESLRALLSEDAARAEMELQKMREAIKTLETEKLDLRQQIVLLTARMADDDECSVNNDAACVSYSTSANTLELHGKLPSHGNDTSELHHSLESRLVGESESEERTNRQEQIEGNSSEVANVEGNQMLSTVALLESDRSEQYGRLTDAKLEEEVRHSIEEQNALLREHITENWCMQENLFEDVGHLMVLNNELETAVEALKGELWSLNGQLKASLADREELSEKLCEMARLRENEREEARERERELEDQKEMAERSQRQAALAENESNRRLAEWQEKSAEMEARREEVEAAYALLTTYYQQLQEAYSTLYARFCIAKADATTEMHAEGEQPDEHHPQLSKAKLEIESLREELEARQEELGKAKSQLEQLRALAITELSSLRKLVLQIRGEEITRLKNAIVESISETANELREIYEHAIEILSNADRIRDAERAESICAMRELVEEIFKKSEREIAVINDVSLTSAVQMAKEELCEKQRVVEETRKALAEQRMACRALECKLQEAEAEREVNNYTHELEQLLETTQISLSRHIDKCQRLQERVDLLERSEEGQRNANEAVGGVCSERTAVVSGNNWNTEGDMVSLVGCAQYTPLPATSHLQMAILAARLTTKRADNDALFRCNAELAHTNVRLQNEVDQLRAQLDELSTASLSSDRPAEHTEPSQIAQVVSDVGSGVIDWGGGEQEALGDWEWGGLGEKEIGKSEDESAFTSERSAKLSEIVEAEGLNTCLEIAQTVETMKTVRPFGTEATGRTQIETGCNQQSGIPETRFEDMERHANSLLAEKENLLAAKESLCDEVNKLSVRLNEMEKMYAEERERRVQLEVQLNSRASIEASQPSSNSMKQPSLEGSEENGWGWGEQVEINELVRSPYVDSDIECDRLNKIITHLQGELCVAQQSFEKMTERHLESEHSQRKMQEEFDRERTEFMARMNYSEQMVKDLKDELENASKQILFAHQANARICELKEENARLQKGETSLRRLLEGLEKKLGDSEDYGLNMEEKNEKLEATVAELQLELANAVKNLDETAANLQQADRSKEQETAEERRETHESLVIVEKLREEVAALKHERKELTEKLLQAGTKQAEEVEEQSKGHENELCSLRERYESNQRELMKKITMLETDSMKMTVEINRLNEKLLEGESKAAKVDELLMKLSEYERTVVEKSEELILSRRENETLNSEMQLLKEDISQRTAKLNELNSEVESANKVVEHLQNELRQTKRQNELLQDSECRLMESADQNERRVGEVEAENDRLVIELKNMETKLSAALTKEGERCVLIEELEARISEAENKLTNTRHELEEREALLATRIQSSYESRMVQTTFTPNEAPLPDAESATAAVCASSNEDVDNLKARLRFLEEKQRDSEFTAIQNEQLLSKIDALEQDYKKLSAEKTLLLKRIKIMKAKLDAYKEEAETHSMRADSSLFLLGSEASKLRRTSAEPLCDEAHLSSVESTVCDISLTSATNPPSQQNQQEMMRRGVKENDVDLDETIRQLQTTKEAFAIELERLDGLRSACEGCKVQVGASIQALLVANGHDVTDKRPTYCLQPESHEARLEDGKRAVLQKNSTQEEFSCQEYIGSAEIEIGLEAECCEDRTDLQSRKSSELEGVSKPRADGLLKASENDGAQTGSKDSETTPSNLVDVTDDVFQVVDTNQCNGVQLFECRGKRTWDELCKLGVKLLMNLKQLNEELERALNSNVKVSKLFQAECSQCKALIESKRAHVQESEHHERLRRLPVEGNEQDINMCEHEQSIKHLTANCERIQEEDVELAACTKQLWTTGDKRRAEVGLIDEQLLRTNEENSAMCVQSGVQIINSNEIGPTLHALISGSLCINYDEIDVGANSQVECIAEQSLERENLKPSEQSLTVVEGPSKQEAESLELNRQTTQDLQLKLCKVEEENIRLKAQLKDARAAQIRVSKLEAENIELEGRWDVLRSEADDMELENVELRSSLGEMRRMKRQAEDIATEVLGLRANLEAAQATEARMKELEADNAQLRISLEGENVLKNRLHEVEISNEHLEATMRELQAKLEAAEAVKARVKELEADNAQLKISLEGENVLNDRLRELEVDNEHLKRNLANLNVSNNVVEAEVGDLKEKLAEAQVRVKDLEAEIIEHHEKSAKIKETLRDKNAEIVQLRATMRLVKRAEIGMQKLQSENLVLKKRLGAEINELFDSDSGQRKNLGDYGVKLPTTTKEGAMVGGLRSAEEGIGDEGSQTNGWDLGGLENHIDQRTPPATSGMLDSELVGVLERVILDCTSSFAFK
ncbi:hypothetical protein Tcan_09037 [Toxocara canis]|uniref:Uncharacterized protein n=1 Tax=Toxocara canis TaxID=6265 RepID=A0A0B2VBS2_TOXCA|nr:hypothetical protein Tcan_09037 [Toxocara canis]